MSEIVKKESISSILKKVILEMYAVFNNAKILIESYPFTGFSGTIGPKLKNGDKQIPEGIYSVEYLNPNSKFYLSIKINYPNDFDREKASLDGRVDMIN